MASLVVYVLEKGRRKAAVGDSDTFFVFFFF